MKIKNTFAAGLILIVALSAGAFSFARADDDDDDDDDREENHAPSATTTTSPTTSDKSSSSPKTVTKTVIVEPAKIVTSVVMQNVELPDSDRDGIADEADPYPNIPEQIIASDTNLDGIDDLYELQTP